MKRAPDILKVIAAVALFAVAPLAVAKITVNVTGVDPTLERNVHAFLSITRYETRDDVTTEIMTRLARRIPSEVRKALEPLGYFAASATYTFTADEKNKSQWQVNIAVKPGQPVLLSQVTIQVHGAGEKDTALTDIVERGDLQVGERLNQGLYDNVKATLLRTAINRGYLDAKLTRNDLLIDPKGHRATIDLQLQTGARFKFGDISFTQPVLKDSAARRLLRMQPGDPYSLDALLQTQYVLDDSQYFSGVEIEPGEPDRDTGEVPLSIHAKKNKRHRYAISGGYGTDTRLRGTLTWDNRYVNDSGHRSEVQLQGSAIAQSAAAKYIVPVMDVALEKVEFDLSGTKELLGDVRSRRIEFDTGLTQALGSWQRVLFVKLSRETNELVPDAMATADTPIIGVQVPAKAFLIIPGISFATMPPNLLEQTHRRYSVYSELSGSPSTLGSDATFLQLRAQGERIFDLSRLWHLRLRGQFGLTWSDNFDTLPASQRFFAGGDNSVRGYGLNEISPVVNIVRVVGGSPVVSSVRVGGRYLLFGSVEFERDLPRNFGVAVFTDVGNAFDHLSDPFKYSVGIGGRYHLAGVASIGIDLAQSLADTSRSPHWHLSLTTLF